MNKTKKVVFTSGHRLKEQMKKQKASEEKKHKIRLRDTIDNNWQPLTYDTTTDDDFMLHPEVKKVNWKEVLAKHGR